jgi:hypothetical protein
MPGMEIREGTQSYRYAVKKARIGKTRAKEKNRNQAI